MAQLACAWVKSKQDPFYDSETYRSQGGDGTVHWYYDRVSKQARTHLCAASVFYTCLHSKAGSLATDNFADISCKMPTASKRTWRRLRGRSCCGRSCLRRLSRGLGASGSWRKRARRSSSQSDHAGEWDGYGLLISSLSELR